ncbi:hypothetical protein C6I21_00420 [Alkalicoccus urumqiensis]|uniref:N-acetyltransferase domain-containing protein n=2 Tax=Alkalicoccus urumqiensis TaxID=1548213 RepID=A0A2P6MLA5_ALKUR|nr:hypothetical protein C6I21_00420 [Alkalicoccus urumqiensis]
MHGHTTRHPEKGYVELDLEWREAGKEEDHYLGRATVFLFNTRRHTWEEVQEAAKDLSLDVENTIGTLEHTYADSHTHGLVAVMQHFEICLEHQGKGYGTRFLEEILDSLDYMEICCVGVMPKYVTPKPNHDERIRKMFQKKGFAEVEREEREVMARTL